MVCSWSRILSQHNPFVKSFQTPSKLLRRPIQTWSAPLPPNTDIIQTVDGGYGVTTLWNKKTKAPKRSFWRLWNHILEPFVEKHAEKTLIVTWKCVADYLRMMQEKGQIPPELAIQHYGNTGQTA